MQLSHARDRTQKQAKQPSPAAIQRRRLLFKQLQNFTLAGSTCLLFFLTCLMLRAHVQTGRAIEVEQLELLRQIRHSQQSEFVRSLNDAD